MSFGNTIGKLFGQESSVMGLAPAIGGALGLANPIMGLIGAGLGKFGNGKDDVQRYGEEFEPRQRQAQNELSSAMDNRVNLQKNTAQVGAAQRAALEGARSGAVAQAAMQGAGASAAAGLGGNVNSALISGIRSAAPVMAAGAQYDQAKADTFAQQQQADMGLNQMQTQQAKERANIANMTNYVYQPGSSASNNFLGATNALGSLTNSIYEGGNNAASWAALFGYDKSASGEITPPPQPPTIDGQETLPPDIGMGFLDEYINRTNDELMTRQSSVNRSGFGRPIGQNQFQTNPFLNQMLAR
jgi:hypothetical protein